MAQAIRKALTKGFRPAFNLVEKKIKQLDSLIIQFGATPAGAQRVAEWTDFGKVSESKVREVQDKLNNRPRKCLGWRTPNEIFSDQAAIVALPS